MKKKNILIAPLDWGLGHATRCIPIARALEKNGYNVLFCAGNRSLDLLIKEFPKNTFIKLDGYNISYPKNGWMMVSMLIQIPKILFQILKEHKALKQIVKDYNIEGVISDNRYGMFNKNIPSIFITHQLNIQSPFFSDFIQKVNFFFINKYTQCWIPDSSNRLLSANLSQIKGKLKKHLFTGPLSRFERLEKTEQKDILAIVSGPEPQRSLFEKILMKQLINSNYNATLVLGKPEKNENKQIGNLKIFSHLDSHHLNQEMVNADMVISRSGYSTIMDLAVLNKKAIFIPTPGQTEQLYLAQHFQQNNIAPTSPQHLFELENCMNESENYKGFENLSNQENWKELFMVFEG